MTCHLPHSTMLIMISYLTVELHSTDKPPKMTHEQPATYTMLLLCMMPAEIYGLLNIYFLVIII